MPLSADIVGRPLPEQVIRVTPRMALAYAAGIGDDNAVCYDDTRPDFMAHPAYCVSPEWQVVIANRSSGLGLKPEEAVRGVHAGQNTAFHRPIRPGIAVRVGGEIVEVRATGAGALARSRLRTTNAETGELLVETLTSSMYRGVAVSGDNRTLGAIADITETWTAQAEATDDVIALDRWFAHRYTECANIWNPIHSERQVALAAGLPDIIVHGTALWALAGRALIRAYAPGQPQRLEALAGRFSAMVLPGTPIIVRHGRMGDGAIAFTVLNEAGQTAISRGVATFS
jgi:acyl dehydratase